MTGAEADCVIAALAARQRGVVARAQLLSAGMGPGAVARRVRQRRLHPVHGGIYLVGHPVFPLLARETAALLACGAGAALSHRSAAAIWGFSTEPGSWVDVVVSGRECGRRGGIRLHRTCRLDPEDVAVRSGLRVTRPARTLIDLAATSNDRSLVRLVDEARIAAAVTDEELGAAIRRAPRGPGRSRLSALLSREAGPSVTRSEAERRFLDLAAASGLPAPETNVRVGRHLVDAVWPTQRVIVEIDGFAFHGSRAAFERDRRRDAELAALGYRVIRVTWRQLESEPHAVVARLAGALAAPGPGPGPAARSRRELGLN